MTNPSYPTSDERYAVSTPPKKKRKIFRWVFLAIQVLFLIWIIAGSNSGGSADCGSLDAQTCSDAAAVGTGIGIMLILVLWVIVDIILALTYLIFRKR